MPTSYYALPGLSKGLVGPSSSTMRHMSIRRLPEPSATGRIEVLRSMDGCYVYQAFCRCGDLLYVGITNDLFSRMTGHRRTRAEWEVKMAAIEWSFYAKRAAAEIVERHLIETSHPLYNRVHSRPRPRPRSLPLPRAFSDDELHQAAVAAYRGVSYMDWFWGQAA